MPSTTEMLARSSDAMARRFADDACRAKHLHLTRAAIYGQWFIEALKDGGLPEKAKDGTDVKQVLGLVIDALSEAIGLVGRDADNHGIAPEAFPLDMDDLLAMWRKLDDEPLFGDIARLAPRFPEVSCSQCGQSFGPGDNGFSHCKNHAHLRGKQ